MYAVVDIETTGSNTGWNRIIEVAAIITDGTKIIDSFHSLVNPSRRIPPFITSLTGISQDDVAGAPSFEEIARELCEFLDGKIFVAHNVSFDYGFLKSELENSGFTFNPKRLCTVRLSRKILPGIASYSLGNLCRDLNIRINGRHRAGGDAQATAELFHLLLKHDKDEFITHSLKRNSREAVLPPHVSKEEYLALPERPGVYFFHDKNGKVLYVGKAKNIKKRVAAHFTGKSETRQKTDLLEALQGITYEICGNDLISSLTECHYIKKHWPPFNREFKKQAFSYGIFTYEDRNGFKRMSIGKLTRQMKADVKFRYIADARVFLMDKYEKFDLCPKFCGLQTTTGACTNYRLSLCKGACAGNETPAEYNERVFLALQDFESEIPTYALIGKGRGEDESSLVLVERGNYLGYGYMPRDIQANDFNTLKDFINYQKDNQDIQKILRRHKGNLRKGEKLLEFTSKEISVPS